MATRAKSPEKSSRTRPAHSSFEAPAYGEVYDPKEHVGDMFYDIHGNTCVVTQGGGSKIIKKA